MHVWNIYQYTVIDLILDVEREKYIHESILIKINIHDINIVSFSNKLKKQQ